MGARRGDGGKSDATSARRGPEGEGWKRGPRLGAPRGKKPLGRVTPRQHRNAGRVPLLQGGGATGPCPHLCSLPGGGDSQGANDREGTCSLNSACSEEALRAGPIGGVKLRSYFKSKRETASRDAPAYARPCLPHGARAGAGGGERGRRFRFERRESETM
eukprot:41-Chlamydomonas_euryale.AAC.1